MFHFLYKTTNLINNKIYYGAHSTENIDDGYLGSGSLLRKALRKYGKENFKREILKFFENKEQLYLAEEELISKALSEENALYNLKPGGWIKFSNGEIISISKGMVICKDIETNKTVKISKDQFDGKKYVGQTKGKVVVKDDDGMIFQTSVDDPRYLSGKLSGVTKNIPLSESHKNKLRNRVTVKNEDGENFQVAIDDPRYLSGELKGINSGFVTVKDENGKMLKVATDDPRYLSGELRHNSVGRITVKDKEGNTFSIFKDDPRYLSGELVGVMKGISSKRKKTDRVDAS